MIRIVRLHFDETSAGTLNPTETTVAGVRKGDPVSASFVSLDGQSYLLQGAEVVDDAGTVQVVAYAPTDLGALDVDVRLTF